MKVVSRRDKLNFGDLLYIYIYAYLPHIYMLQLTEILLSVTNGLQSYIPDLLNKYFTRST